MLSCIANTTPPPTVPTGTDTTVTGDESNKLTAKAIVGMVFGVLIFIGFITTIIILCICCLTPSCPCYYNRRSHITTHSAFGTPKIVTATTATSAKTTKYQPPPLPGCDHDTGYQPYPAVPPTATTAKY